MRQMKGGLIVLVLFLGCGGGTSGTSANLVADCKSQCQRQRDAQCPNDTLTRCENVCEQHGGIPGCETKFDALVTCAMKSSIMCNAAGSAVATDCPSQSGDLLTCVLTGGAGGGTGGASGAAGTGGSGTAAAQSCGGGMSWSTACLTCLKANCAAPFADAYGSQWQLEKISSDGSCGPLWKCYCDCRTGQAACPAGGISACQSTPSDLPPGCSAAMSSKDSCASANCDAQCNGQI